MDGNHPIHRTYSSTLRQEQERLTHDRIMEAVASLLVDGRIHSFSVQDVAARAGVSYGSVYRHFPTKERLLEALYEWLQQNRQQPALPDALNAVPAFVEQLVALFEANAPLAEASAIAVTALGTTPDTQREHDQQLRSLVAEADPNLDERQIREKAAVIRYLVSSLAWATLRHRFGLDGAEITTALNWALRVLIRDIEGTQPAEQTARKNGR